VGVVRFVGQERHAGGGGQQKRPCPGSMPVPWPSASQQLANKTIFFSLHQCLDPRIYIHFSQFRVFLQKLKVYMECNVVQDDIYNIVRQFFFICVINLTRSNISWFIPILLSATMTSEINNTSVATRNNTKSHATSRHHSTFKGYPYREDAIWHNTPQHTVPNKRYHTIPYYIEFLVAWRNGDLSDNLYSWFNGFKINWSTMGLWLQYYVLHSIVMQPSSMCSS